MPKSTLDNWMIEFKSWCPSVKTVCLIGDKETRTKIIRDVLLICDWDVCITTFEMCARENQFLKNTSWWYMFVDEAHRIKNEESDTFTILQGFKTMRRFLMTGTPIQNNLRELWTLLNFLDPKQFARQDEFVGMFNNRSLGGELFVVKQLHRMLKPYLLRRLKSQVEKSLQPKMEVRVVTGLSDMQKDMYNQIKDSCVKIKCGSKIEVKRLKNVIMQLRKCINHPFLFDGQSSFPSNVNIEQIVNNSGKMAFLDKLLPKLIEQKSRILIFSQMTRMLDILEKYCVLSKYHYSRLDGQTKHADRYRHITEYNAKNSKKFIFLLSTRAGGVGINLATADVVVLFDSDWNPQIDLQAIDRAHRITQKKQVRVFRFITKGTIEDKIIERAEEKLRLDKLVIQAGKFSDDPADPLNENNVLDIIRFVANNPCNSCSSDVTSEDVEHVLKKFVKYN